jgi:hypothetical protein
VPSVLNAPDDVDACFIKISGDNIIMDPSLKVKPSAGVQVNFEFKIKEGHNKKKWLAGTASVWAIFETEPTPPDADDYDEVSGFDGLLDQNDVRIDAEVFHGLDGMPMAPLTMYDLARLQLGGLEVYQLEEALIEGALKAFSDTYSVVARIRSNKDGRTIEIEVSFKRAGGAEFTFEFWVHRKVAEQYFIFEEPAAAAA